MEAPVSENVVNGYKFDSEVESAKKCRAVVCKKICPSTLDTNQQSLCIVSVLIQAK